MKGFSVIFYLTCVHNEFQAHHASNRWNERVNGKTTVDNANKCVIAIRPARICHGSQQLLSGECSAAMANVRPATIATISNSIDEQLQSHKTFPMFYHPIWDRAAEWIQAFCTGLRKWCAPTLFCGREYCIPTKHTRVKMGRKQRTKLNCGKTLALPANDWKFMGIPLNFIALTDWKIYRHVTCIALQGHEHTHEPKIFTVTQFAFIFFHAFLTQFYINLHPMWIAPILVVVVVRWLFHRDPVFRLRLELLALYTFECAFRCMDKWWSI